MMWVIGAYCLLASSFTTASMISFGFSTSRNISRLLPSEVVGVRSGEGGGGSGGGGSKRETYRSLGILGT